MNRRALARAGAIMIAALTLITALAGTAWGDSIAYLKGGNVWLSTPDGTQGYQLTFGGGWDSPSQADDGTIMAVNGGQTYRLTPSGTPVGAPVPTIFQGADPTTSHGPFGVRISPDGTKRAYYGDVYTSYTDFTCGCIMYRWEAATRWGASDQFSEPNQTRGQELYGQPAWVDNSTLMLTDIGGVFAKQVALYTVGGGDNSMTQWFSDPDSSVRQLQFGAITRAADKLAFVATTQTPQDQIRLYQSGGPPPNPPTPVCAITGATGGQFSYLSFSPDGGQLAWQDAAGIHISAVSNLNDCSTITDQLILPGGSEPSFGPANLNPANAPTPPSGNPAATPPPSGSGTPRAGAPAGSPSRTPGGHPNPGHPQKTRRHTRAHRRHRHSHHVTATKIR